MTMHCDCKYASCPAQTIREDIWFLRPITEQCQHAWHHSPSLYAWQMPSTRLDDAHAPTCVLPKVPQLQEITGSSLALSVKREAPNPSTVTYGRCPGVKCPQRRRRTLTGLTYTGQHVHNNASANVSAFTYVNASLLEANLATNHSAASFLIWIIWTWMTWTCLFRMRSFLWKRMYLGTKHFHLWWWRFKIKQYAMLCIWVITVVKTQPWVDNCFISNTHLNNQLIILKHLFQMSILLFYIFPIKSNNCENRA